MAAPFLGGKERNVQTNPPAPAAVTGDKPATDLPPSAAQVAKAGMSVAMEGGSKLVVGPNIKLKGNSISDCDTLVVEGLVEATMKARVMQIAEQGAYKGTAELDLAEIHGRFEGDLTVRQTLYINATGTVTGKVRYGRIVITEGGMLSGEVNVGAAAPSP
ncbi:polymer-forming cytoskeletal protein [Variovorax sp. Sphag1AA]|uniref:bactofilin family protein n=1 Tax=Variovorax sp. Sphag1AA TaxID=2587027 RepID=UPI001622C323|nr:polymer-forming cytoskeletal protein [Variovorax sp. Sphag1AA]MBB3179268.1 cytoskeletal protein CcmA (bactofilin family) [Variovorax sp. Sphag1AA]